MRYGMTRVACNLVPTVSVSKLDLDTPARYLALADKPVVVVAVVMS